MKIYDITQELFTSNIYPGDPAPTYEALIRLTDGGTCNLSALRLCAHNGTHLDAPWHFIEDGKRIDEIDLSAVIGPAYVAAFQGTLRAQDAEAILRRAAAAGDGCEKRILIKGKAVVSAEAAAVFADAGILLVGNESQTVGPEDAPRQVHLILLGKGIVLLEGIVLSAVPEGKYLLSAAPLKLGGLDGAPCRAVLLREEA